MPLYEDLVRRALAARNRAATVAAEVQRIRELSRLLREAGAGTGLLVHCAWCGKLQVGDELLQLEAVGSGQQRITAS